jgi:hypothetical protein
MYDKAKRAEFIAMGQEAYEKLKSELEPAHEGEIVAIHLESGDHFQGKTLNEADEKAFARYPDQWLYFARIGSPEAALPLKTW